MAKKKENANPQTRLLYRRHCWQNLCHWWETVQAPGAGETGWLVAPGDAAALSDALSHLWDTAAARARFGEAGIAHVAAHFTTEKMCAATLALYRSLLTA